MSLETADRAHAARVKVTLAACCLLGLGWHTRRPRGGGFLCQPRRARPVQGTHRERNLARVSVFERGPGGVGWQAAAVGRTAALYTLLCSSPWPQQGSSSAAGCVDMQTAAAGTCSLTRRNAVTGVRYRDDPTIMAWDVMNEPRCPGEARRACFQLCYCIQCSGSQNWQLKSKATSGIPILELDC